MPHKSCLGVPLVVRVLQFEKPRFKEKARKTTFNLVRVDARTNFVLLLRLCQYFMLSGLGNSRIYKQASCRGWIEVLRGILLKEMSKYTKPLVLDSRCPAKQAASNSLHIFPN